GEPLDPAALVALELPQARSSAAAGEIVAHALYVDRFGNVQLSVGHAELNGSGLRLGHPVEIELRGERFGAKYATTFADVLSGEILLYEDAYRTLALAVNRGSAAH